MKKSLCMLTAVALMATSFAALAESPAEELAPEDAAVISQITDEGLIGQAGFFRSVIPGPLTLKQSYNFAAYAGFVLPDFVREWSLGGTGRDYSTLPELMTFADGTPVDAQPEALALRREEMLDLLQNWVYGPVPAEGFMTAFEVLEEGEALDGQAHRKQVQITVTTEKGSLPMNVLLYTPADVSSAPVIMCLTSGNHTVLADEAILPAASQDSADESWKENLGSSASAFQVEKGISEGYGYAFVSVDDIAPDNMDGYATRMVSLFDEPDMMALSAWAFGLSRTADYLVSDDLVDAERIAVYGHSRYGKAALWTGAVDDRVALVFAHQSGGGGAALNRANNADNISSLTKMEPWWFCQNYASYADDPDGLPVDSHFTIACVAPRKIYVSNGAYDMWADPQGSLNGLLYARPMFEAYGLDVIPADYQPNECELKAGEHIWTSSMSTHVTEEFHTASEEDWNLFFAYMNEYLN